MASSFEAGCCAAVAEIDEILAARGSLSPNGASPHAGASDAGVEVDATSFGVGSHLVEGGSPLVTR